MRKKVIEWCLVLCALLAMTGCGTDSEGTNTYKSYTFSVETGDSVKILLDTSDDYDMTLDLPFEISSDDEVLSQGIFITADDYEQYVEVVNNDEGAVLLESSTKDGNQYIFWSYNDAEYDYAILIADSNTGVLLGNNVSKESAEECFERLEISLTD